MSGPALSPNAARWRTPACGPSVTSFCTHSSMNFCVFFLSPDDLYSLASTPLCVVTCLTAFASSTPSKMKPKRSSHLHEGGGVEGEEDGAEGGAAA